MNAGTEALIKALLLQHSMSDTMALLKNSLSEPISYEAVDKVRRLMVLNREIQPRRGSGDNRGRIHNPNIEPLEPARCYYQADGEQGSRDLLRAHLCAGKHWITDPVVFAEACASVGLSA